MNPRIPLLGLVCLAGLLLGATHDNNVEWNGISHVDWLDRWPRCPINGEAFTVFFQTYHYDITSARVYVTTGGGAWVDAQFLYEKGVYDVWGATLPASTPTTSLQYYIELTDGTDTDYLGPSGMSDNAPASGWTIDFATLSHAPLGATLTSDGGAVFKTWAPTATTAYVAGQFNGWSPTSLPMTKSGAYFTRKVAAPVVANQKYKYVFQPGTVWKTDARGRAMDQGDNGNTILVNPATYTWGDDDYRTARFEDMVIYELHVGTFSGRNDGLNRMGRVRDIIDTHISHLLYLGVNAVELMPVTEFDYYESWGYNPIDNFGPENAYGTPDDYRYTIDRLHQNGIAVLTDICYNHFSNSGNYLWYYDSGQIYFDNPAVQTPWGSQAAFWKQEVKDYFNDALLLWLEEYHLDGYRMDATRYMRDNYIFPGGQSAGWALMQRLSNTLKNRKVDALYVAEELPNEPMITTATASGGAGFDSQWHMGFRDAVRQATFDAAYGNPQMYTVRDAINDTTYGNKTKLIRYVESHDETGNGQRLTLSIDSGNPYSMWAQGRAKLAQGLTILAPGIPMFLQGGEWLEETQFGSGTNNRIDWSKAVSRAPIVQFFRDVIGVKRANCAFHSDAGYDVFHTDDGNNVIGMHRWDLSGDDIVVVASWNNSDLNGYQIGFPQSGTWYEILNSQASVYNGNGSGNGGSINTVAVPYDGQPYSAYITIPQMGLLVFRYQDPAGRGSDLNGDGRVDLLDYAELQLDGGLAGCGLASDIQENGRIDAGDLGQLITDWTGPADSD